MWQEGHQRQEVFRQGVHELTADILCGNGGGAKDRRVWRKLWDGRGEVDGMVVTPGQTGKLLGSGALWVAIDRQRAAAEYTHWVDRLLQCGRQGHMDTGHTGP